MTETRTIYVRDGFGDSTLQYEMLNDVPTLLMEIKHGLKSRNTDVTPDDAPPGIKLFRPGPVAGFGELFGNVRFTTKLTGGLRARTHSQ
ncbi:hypothetical protein [Mesobacterium pallidum]|uniref:hypothetical protein n=1 Tax=Mesobacterium pallidum TaxID=2872037 RepID=UPI001EE1E182|nr:hypothetical protein [Mesobacterium pallidum]